MIFEIDFMVIDLWPVLMQGIDRTSHVATQNGLAHRVPQPWFCYQWVDPEKKRVIGKDMSVDGYG